MLSFWLESDIRVILGLTVRACLTSITVVFSFYRWVSQATFKTQIPVPELYWVTVNALFIGWFSSYLNKDKWETVLYQYVNSSGVSCCPVNYYAFQVWKQEYGLLVPEPMYGHFPSFHFFPVVAELGHFPVCVKCAMCHNAISHTRLTKLINK
jgi:hypothetical protein